MNSVGLPVAGPGHLDLEKVVLSKKSSCLQYSGPSHRGVHKGTIVVETPHNLQAKNIVGFLVHTPS